MDYKLLLGLSLLLILTLLTICVYYRNKVVKEDFSVSRTFFSQMEEQYANLNMELNALKLMLNENNDMNILKFRQDVETSINQLRKESASIHDITKLQVQISDIKNDLENNVVRYVDKSEFQLNNV